MRPTNDQLTSEIVEIKQLTPSSADSKLVEFSYKGDSDRFRHVKSLINEFSQKLLIFLVNTHDLSLTDWISSDKEKSLIVRELTRSEGCYPPHVIAFRDLINFLSVVKENLDLLNTLFNRSRNGILVLFRLPLVSSECVICETV